MDDKKVNLHQYRKRERLKTGFMIRLILFALILGTLVYFIYEFMKKVPQSRTGSLSMQYKTNTI